MSNNPQDSPKDILLKILNKKAKFKNNTFWNRNPNNGRHIIDPSMVREFIIENGFNLLDFFGTKLIIKNTYNIVDFCTPQDIFNYCLKFTQKEGKESLVSEFIVTGAKLLITSKALLGSLPILELSKCRDSKISSLYFFKNTVVEVDINEIKQHSYNILKKRKQFIYKSQIINRHFDKEHKPKPQIAEFFKLASNSKKHNLNIIIIIGYLLHKYKNPSISKAVIISDVLSQATNEPHGRSGKGIIIRALSQLINVVEYNGKNLDLRRDKFVYQSIEPDSDIFAIQDVGKSFDFEDLFSTITDSLNIERKHQKKIIVDNADSPKIVITTNYNVPHNSDSYSDRKVILLLNNYFNSQNKPEHIFKNLFFSEWNTSEFKAFDLFMMKCLQKYLKYGFIEYDDPALRKQNLISNTSKEFLELVEKKYSSKKEYYNIKDLANQLEINSNAKNVRSKIVSKWLEIYANHKGLKLDTRVSGGITKFNLSKKLTK